MKMKPPKKLEKRIREVRVQTEPRIADALFGVARKLPAVRLKKLLAPVDFSMFSMAGARYAVSLADKLGADISLIHVVENAPLFGGEESVLLARSDVEVVKLAESHASRLAQRLSKKGLSVGSFVRHGKPFHEICTLADAQHADVIVLATHGRTGLKRILIGSTAERVVRHAPCPVLTIPSPSRRRSAARTFRLKKIVVPIDFSEASVQALPYAATLAQQFDAEIVLLHVLEEFPIDYLLGQGRGLMNETITPLMMRAEADLSGMAGDLKKSAGLGVSSAVRYGKPFEEICSAAEELDAGLIVLSTHGYTGLKHVWLGSTAERVVRHASRPVLVVREHTTETRNTGKRNQR